MSDGISTRLDAEFGGDPPEYVDDAAFERLKTVAYLMDEAVRVPGTEIRVGLDPLVSSLPVIGDLVSGGFSLYIVAEAAYLGVSYTTIVRMLANIAVDVAGGSLPFVGTLFDAVWKTNTRNVELLLDDLAPDRPEQSPDDATPDSGSAHHGVTIEVEEPSQ